MAERKFKLVENSPDEKCRTCRWFYGMKIGGFDGQCRRRAPVGGNIEITGFGTFPNFPFVFYQDNCGEYEWRWTAPMAGTSLFLATEEFAGRAVEIGNVKDA